jgi:hypothetical protein
MGEMDTDTFGLIVLIAVASVFVAANWQARKTGDDASRSENYSRGNAGVGPSPAPDLLR